MTDPTVEAYKKFRPVDDTLCNRRNDAEGDSNPETWDAAAIALSNAIPNSAAGLLIHHRMIERYLTRADGDSEGSQEIPANLHDLIDRHTRSLAAGARQLRGVEQPSQAA